MNNEIELGHFYRQPTLTTVLMADIKLIKKVNTAINKYLRTSKEIYIDEARNILSTINNSIHLGNALDQVLYYIEDNCLDIVVQILRKDVL